MATGARTVQLLIALICFFLSGFAGLVYEVVWIRQASLLFGSTTFALSTVLAVFFLGLACGSYLFGRYGQRTGHPLLVFALVEIGLGLSALASPYAFELADILYGTVYRSLAGYAILHFLTRIVLVGFVILPPTVLMGATLPLFCRQFVRSDAKIVRSVGLLYGINTLGAALGCVCAGFVLLPELGFLDTVRLGAVLNILVGIVAGSLPIARSGLARPRLLRPEERGHWGVFALFFAVGFVALGSEVLWTRYLGLLIANTVYTYTLTLAVVLVGLVLGSVLASLFFDRTGHRARYFGALQVLLGLVVLLLMMLPSDIWRRLGEEWWIYAVLLLPPGVLGGASFPLAVRMVVEDASAASGGTGKIAAVNTLGGIAGALAIGFVGLPFFGLESSLLFITGTSLAVGFAAWIWLDRTSTLTVKAAFIGLFSCVWLGVFCLLPTRIPADFLGEREELVDFREGYGSNLAVIRQDRGLQLEINRWWQGRDRKTHQVMAAHVPMLLHPEPKRVLLVGIGTGQTAARFLLYPIDRLECVDIEPTIFSFIRPHFDSRWMEDPRVKLIGADGRNYLRHTPSTYDVISLELGQLSRPGVASFYTADFYSQVKKRLRSGGFLVQFVPLSLLTTDHFRSTVQSFLEAFPHSLLWYNTSELLLIGSGRDFAIDRAILEGRLSNEKIRRDLEYSHWGGPLYWLNRPQVFLGSYLMGSGGLAELANEAPSYRDDRPVLDYAVARAFVHRTNALPTLDLLHKHLDPLATLMPIGSDEERTIEEIRAKNLREIAASAALRQAKVLIAVRNYLDASKLLAGTLHQLPEHLVVRRTLADVLMRLGRFAEARAHYTQVVEIAPQDVQALDGLALAFHQLGHLDEAIHHYKAALRLQPDRAETCSNLGGALARRGKLKEAQFYLEKALQLKADFADAKRNLAQVQAALQRREKSRTSP
ncbi:MAG: tetratricopeptide repeat protein [Gemmatimonadetes bacterium]|nr:tetratricopeptide repeat protein [Gemmatimonadota bacterium]